MTRIRSVPADPAVRGTAPAAVPALALALALAAACPVSAAEPRSGAEVYTLVCAACHDAGVAGAPTRGDTNAWKPLIAEGQKALSREAIKGVRGMPARGGRPDLSDLEVRRAVAYLSNAAGAKWVEPAK
ncbi:MAG: c-type cytochrome [Burkholderiales bacterium]|nr:c-type cytochrome [Burkholderiales bacterium]